MVKTSTCILAISLLISGCSYKSQINPSSDNYEVSTEETIFDKKQSLNKQIKASYQAGEAAGYNKAKEEFEEVIPYIEAIRASAELKRAGGLCLPPLFLDKSNKNSVAVSLGEAHICDEFTVDNIIKMVKSGIPTLPTSSKQEKVVNEEDYKTFIPSNIVLGGLKEKDYFAEANKITQETKIAKIAGSINNRTLLRNSNAAYSDIELADDKYLYVTFESPKAHNDFCSKYKICEKAN